MTRVGWPLPRRNGGHDMNSVYTVIEASAAAEVLDLELLCRAAGLGPQWAEVALRAGLVSAAPTDGFDVRTLERLRRLAWLQSHFDADPELAALVVQLEDEIERLRARLRRLGASS